MRQKNQQICDTSSNWKKFRTRNFLKHAKTDLRNVSVLWDKIYSMQNRDTPFLSMKVFDTGTVLKHRRVHLRSILVLWDKKTSTKSWHLVLLKKSFQKQKLCETQNGSSTNRLGTVRHKIFDKFVICKKFWNKKFSEHRSDNLPNVSVLWNK